MGPRAIKGERINYNVAFQTPFDPLRLFESGEIVVDSVFRICVEVVLGVRDLTVWGFEPKIPGWRWRKLETLTRAEAPAEENEKLEALIDRLNTKSVTASNGIDQTALFLNGEGHGRRHYMVHYSSANVGAVRIGDYKAVMGGGVGGGLPQFETYNIVRDPGERYGKVYPYLWFIQPLNDLMRDHNALIQKFPHNTYGAK